MPRSAPAGLTSRRRNLTGRVRPPPDSRHSQAEKRAAQSQAAAAEAEAAREGEKYSVSVPKFQAVGEH